MFRQLLRYAGLAIAALGVLGLALSFWGRPLLSNGAAREFLLGGLLILGLGEISLVLKYIHEVLFRIERMLRPPKQEDAVAAAAVVPVKLEKAVAVDKADKKVEKVEKAEKAENPQKAEKVAKPVKQRPWETGELAIISLGDEQECRMYCPNVKAYARSTDMLTKEPGTIAWLNGMGGDDLLWDVGANIGLFTIYASMKRKCRVIAFEPGSANYMVLNRNIEVNDLQNRVSAFCMSVAQKSMIDYLYMPGTDFGSALSNFGASVNYQGTPFDAKFKQGSVGFCLDDLSTCLPFPSHIKIDVDGLEKAIALGGPAFFRDGRLKSALIELDVASQETLSGMAELMGSYGLVHINLGIDVGKRKVVNAIYERRG